MFIRCAFFRGKIKPGQEQIFDAHIQEELVALWTRFPHVQEVRVLRQKESDTQDPHFEMVLAMRFPTREAITEALDSDVRYASREASKRLFELFDGEVFHTVFDAAEFSIQPG
jgi:antibiotic biosynthesis monooxygenase (ABM) superfamily enzyme